MKLVMRYLKPFLGVVLLCILLLFSQAMCDLSLPNLMSDLVNIGIQQGGLNRAAPEALSEKGLILLKTVMPEKEQAFLDEAFLTVEPQSSEAQRFAEKYPLIREETLCILRDDLGEETRKEAEKLYGQASYALLLYLQESSQNGELTELAAQAKALLQSSPAPEQEEPLPGLGDNLQLPDLSGETEEKIPDGALFSLPGEENEEGEEDAPKQEPPSFSMEGGISRLEAGRLYGLIPLLQIAPKESLCAAWNKAGEADSMMGSQVGVSMARLFYRELGIDLNRIQRSFIFVTSLKMLGVTVLGALCTILVGFFSSRVAGKVGKKLRHDLFAKVESFSSAEFDKFTTASLITRTTNDVQQIQMLITMGIRLVCYAPIMGIGGIVFALGKSVSMSWIIAVAVAVMIGLVLIALSVALPKFKMLQKLIDRLNLVSRENLSGMLVVRAFGNERHEEARFEKANRELADTNRFVQRVMALMMPSMMFMMNLTSLVIIWVGGRAIAASTLQIGDMMAFIQYAMQIISSFLMIAVMFVMIPRASVSAARIREVLDMPLEILDDPQAVGQKETAGKLEFRHVSFRYPNAREEVLHDLSFTALPGETTAFIGATGSGKSTLINLIPRFYDVTEGEILLDGVDLRKLPQKELREKIGYVPQKSVLFSGSIRSNLEYGKEEASEEELKGAVETAQAADFVSRLEKGLESPIAQGGDNVSGGQKQRLSIARALMRKAPIYIFDDSFSALDFKTDAVLRRALKERTGGSTVLLVAQRVSTIRGAEQIIVLDEGKMVGRGTHRELMENCPAYREIAQSQLSKEELE